MQIIPACPLRPVGRLIGRQTSQMGSLGMGAVRGCLVPAQMIRTGCMRPQGRSTVCELIGSAQEGPGLAAGPLGSRPGSYSCVTLGCQLLAFSFSSEARPLGMESRDNMSTRKARAIKSGTLSAFPQMPSLLVLGLSFLPVK